MVAEPEVKIFTAPLAARYNAMNVFLVHVSLEFIAEDGRWHW